MISPFCKPAFSAGAFAITDSTVGASYPTNPITNKESANAKRKLKKGPAKITENRCHTPFE